jgi:hypothetical protein
MLPLLVLCLQPLLLLLLPLLLLLLLLLQCKLYRSVQDADWVGMHHVQGNKLFSDGFVREHISGNIIVGEM